MLALRDYQLQALRQIANLYKQGHRRQLCVLPTGSGKTVVFSHLSKRFGKRTLILAPREELLTQAQEKLMVIGSDINCGIVQGKRNEHDKQVVIASIQTLSRPERLDAINKEFGLVILDECHHATSPTWISTLEKLGCFEKDGPLVVGFTATPNRTDNVGLGKVFETVAYQRTILDMLMEGYLADIKGLRIDTKVDLSGVKIVAGDFDEKELNRRVNNEERNNIIVNAFIEHCPKRNAIAFAASIAHAENLAEVFKKHGVASEAVSGKTPHRIRKKLLQDFHYGKIQVLTNNNLLIEGFDEPKVDCVILARPTQSTSFYTQMIGRGLRLYPGKENCIVLDVTDNTITHNILSTPRIFGMTEEQVERMEKEGTSVLQEKAREQLQFTGKADVTFRTEEIDIFAGSIFSWITNGKSYFLVLPEEEMISLTPDEKEPDLYHTILYKGTTTRLINKKPVPLEWAQGTGETFVRRNRAEAIKVLRRDSRWQNEEPTEGQLEALRKAGKIIMPGLTRGKASRMISLIIANSRERRAQQEVRQQIAIALEPETQVEAKTPIQVESGPAKEIHANRESDESLGKKTQEQKVQPVTAAAEEIIKEPPKASFTLKLDNGPPKEITKPRQSDLTPRRKNYLLDLLRDRQITLNVELGQLTNRQADSIIKSILAKQENPLIKYPGQKS
jgi:superfamily II DNA or RNA helicase